MIAAVIPAKNEGDTIGAVLDNLKVLPIDCIIPVLNGCTDHTLLTLTRHPLRHKLSIIRYPQPLGIDVPRAIGAIYAKKLGAQAVLFIDGDMIGHLSPCCARLIDDILAGWDLTLTNCYPYAGYRSCIARQVLDRREHLNRLLGVFPKLGLATPSHGPHCVSKRLLGTVAAESFAIPPLMLAQAVKNNLRIKVAAALPADEWSSAQRGNRHNSLIAETIIGDCLQAEHDFLAQPLTRSDGHRCYLGYHPQRNFTAIALAKQK